MTTRCAVFGFAPQGLYCVSCTNGYIYFKKKGGGLGVFSAFCCRALVRLVVNYSLDCHLLQFGTLNVCTYRISLTIGRFATEKVSGVSYVALKRVLV